MALSRTPSPRPNGGWSIQGLTNTARNPSVHGNPYAGMNGFAASDAHWAAAKAKSESVRGYPRFQSRNEGFFQRSRRKISATLPRFNNITPDKKHWKDTEKLGRGRSSSRGVLMLSQLKTFVGNVLRRFKVLFVLLAIFFTIVIIMSEMSELSIASLRVP